MPSGTDPMGGNRFLLAKRKKRVCAGDHAQTKQNDPIMIRFNLIGSSSSRRAELCKRSRLMRKILVIGAVAAAITTPVAAQAQGYYPPGTTTGVVRTPGAIVGDDVGGIAVEQRPAFREYIIRERVPNYVIPDRVVVGSVLPETGVVYYTTYRKASVSRPIATPW
jgi:hypothetical protein